MESRVSDVSDFDNIVESLELMDDLRVAEAELNRGEGIPHDMLKQQVESEGESMRKELGL